MLTQQLRITLLIVGAVINPAVAASDDLAEFYRHFEATRTDRPNREHRVPRGEYQIHANEYEPAVPTRRAPMILMHGFPDSAHLYDRVAPLLAQDRRVISFDFLGWGKSDTPNDHVYDAASLRADLEAVIAHFGFESVVIVVHDSSGLPGIDWVLDNPSRAEGLVLLNTVYGPSQYTIPPPVIKTLGTPGLFSRAPLAFGIRMSVGRFQSGLYDQVSEFFATDEARSTYAKVFSHQAAAIRPAFLGLTKVFFEEVRARAPKVAKIRELRVPTKVVFGADDPYLNKELAREFHSIFPVSRLHLVANAGHYVQLDQPGKVAEAIRSRWPKPTGE